MATPRKKKPSRVDQQQTNTYSYIQGTPLRLVRQINPPTAEDLSETGRRNVLAGGRRSTDKFMGGLYAYWKSLSAREQDVTILVCRGLLRCRNSISVKLSISTVKSYLQHVFRKVQVRNRRQLMVRFANFNFSRNPSPRDRSIDSF